MVNKKFKRVLSLGLVCLMFTPIISFATAKNQSVNNLTTNAVVNHGPYIIGEVSDDEIPEAERQKIALEEAIVEESGEINGHKLVTSTDKYELYLKDTNCSIIIRDKETGAIMNSTVSEEDAKERKYNEAASAMIKSGIAMTIIERVDTNTSRQWDPVGVATEGVTVTCDDIDNGFKATVEYGTIINSEVNIKFEVLVTLDDEGLKVKVPYDSIVESNDKFEIGTLYLYNGMGLTERGDREGYMILPDGNGIKVDFEDNFYIYGKNKLAVKYSSGYVQRVYGEDFSFDVSGAEAYDTTDLIGTSNDEETIIAPFWGMVHTDTNFAVLGIISEGETSAKIEGNFNGVANLYENYAGCRFIYRDVFKRSLSDTIQYQSTVDATPNESLLGDAEVTFLFTTGDKANYIGLAESYRNKLIADGDLIKTTDGELATRVDFLGVDKEEFLVFKTDVVATDIDDVKSILDDMKSNGVDKILAIYEGWQEGGIYETPIKKYDVANSIGGNSAMNDLFDELKGSGIDLYLMTDMQIINLAVESSTYSAAKGFGQKTQEIWSPFLKVYKSFRYLVPSLSNEYMIKLADDMKDEGISNIGFSGMSSYLFAYYRNDVQYSRMKSAEYYENALKEIQNNGMNVMLEKPFKYLWKYTESFLDMPLYSSMFVYATDDIPFITSVLRGTVDVYSEYVNFEANSKEFFLKLVETGIYPSYLITEVSPTELLYTNSSWIYSSEYDLYADRIAEYNEKLGELHDAIGDSTIVAHSKENKVSKTTYSNGVVVYVNFDDSDAIFEGQIIEAMSYMIKVGEAE